MQETTKNIIVLFVFSILTYGVYVTSYWRTEQINTKKEVSQSYVEGKRRELLKYYIEYHNTKDIQVQNAIIFQVRHSFANIDISYFSNDERLYTFLTAIKYGETIK